MHRKQREIKKTVYVALLGGDVTYNRRRIKLKEKEKI
jgi:hypothetical protein